MSAALGLFRLQQVDRQINRIEVRLENIRQTLENDVELQAAMKKVAEAQKEQHEAETARSFSEQEAQAQQVKIQQAESSLYGGAVHNPKELQDLQADVASLKKHLSDLEERELEAMLAVDTAQSAHRAAEQQLSLLQTQRGDEHRKLFEEQGSLTRQLQSLQTERQAAVSAVAAGMLSSYENLRRQRGGVAVAEVAENACAACGTTLTAALQQNARHAVQLTYCPTCGRILYAG